MLHAETALSRLTGQHVDKPKFRDCVASLVESMDDIEPVVHHLSRLDDLEVRDQFGNYLVQGVNLDVVGAKVGQPRRLRMAVPRNFFGFELEIGGFQGAQNFGEEGDLSVGGIFYEEGGVYVDDAILQDAEYRLAIKARIICNHSGAHVEDIYAALRVLLPDSYVVALSNNTETYTQLYPIQVADVGGMALEITIGKDASAIERAMIENAGLLPIASGVAVTYTYQEAP
jgi:hypothetical protein